MEQRLIEAAQEGDITALYELIRRDPNILEGFDKIPFADTPLHAAASAGRTHFALELMRLKPSFGRKLNPDGFSPLDLALRAGQSETARRLANYEPKLIRVQGREGMTPLHYVAEVNDADLLSEFLVICPASVEDMTIRSETAAHVAVRNGSERSFKVLFGWLQRADKMELLNCRDEDGNTVLHIAAFTNQTEVMKLLIKKVELNDRNLEGLTALDVALKHPEEVNAKARKLLTNAGASKASLSHPKVGTLADHLCASEGIREKLIGLDTYLCLGLSADMRNAILVVAVLIATTTFQAVLQPPGGLLQGDNLRHLMNSTCIRADSNITFSIDESDNGRNDDPGNTVMVPDYFYQFMFWNTVTFATSLGIIFLLLPPNRYVFLVCTSVSFLMLDYVYSATVIAPAHWYGAIVIVYLGFVAFVMLVVSVRAARRLRRVIAARHMNGSYNFHDPREVENLVTIRILSSDNLRI